MSEWHTMTALALGREIGRGAIDPCDLAAHFTARIRAADPEHRIFVRMTPARTEAEARAARDRQTRGVRRSPLDGVPISWKDLFDMAGEATEAGSALLKGRTPERDAVALARLTRAGTVALGKTALSEFAFSGLGVNPICGTPPYPFDPATPRAPGGSSAGAAVGLALGLSPAAMGTDTGGSVRIPAAWNGLTGLKTTAGLIPIGGTVPLSRTYDTVGPLTRDVADAAELLALLTGTRVADLNGAAPGRCHFIAPPEPPTEGVESAVWTAFETALERLVAAGARLRREPLPPLAETDRLLNERGNPVTAEAQAEWGELVRAAPDKVFAPIRSRIGEGEGMTAESSAALAAGLADARTRLLAQIAGADAALLPTVGTRPPPLRPLLDDPAAHAKANLAALRLTRLVNFLGLCALTLPAGQIAADGAAPALPFGLTLLGAPFAERRLLRLGAALEPLLTDWR